MAKTRRAIPLRALFHRWMLDDVFVLIMVIIGAVGIAGAAHFSRSTISAVSQRELSPRFPDTESGRLRSARDSGLAALPRRLERGVIPAKSGIAANRHRVLRSSIHTANMTASM